MTVCIAAITAERYIVTLSDTKIGTFMSSADGNTVKVEPFAKDWLAMMAAGDLTQCLPIIERAGRYFDNRANTLQVARSCFKRAYQNHLAELAADTVLGRFGIDMPTFLKTGKRKFSEKTHNSLCDKIREVDSDWEFLAAGFDGKNCPHLFTVESPGKDAVYDKPGFCAIGSGKYVAESMLTYLGQSVVKGFYETLFNVYAAKFMAEKVGIGEHCWFYAKKPGSTVCIAAPWVEVEVRKEWRDKCAPRISTELIARMNREMPVRLVP